MTNRDRLLKLAAERDELVARSRILDRNALIYGCRSCAANIPCHDEAIVRVEREMINEVLRR